jgi:hypothetical protein
MHTVYGPSRFPEPRKINTINLYERRVFIGINGRELAKSENLGMATKPRTRVKNNIRNNNLCNKYHQALPKSMFEHRISAGFRAYFGYQSIQAQGPTAKV